MRSLLKGRNCPGLQGKGLIEIHHPLELAQGADQPLGTDGESQPVAPQTPALGKGEKLNAAVAPMGGTQQGRSLAVEGQIHVRVVVGQHQPMAHRPRGGFIYPGLLTRGGGGVVGVAEHHQLQVVPLLRAEGIKIRSPARLGIERQKHRLSGSQV